MTSTPVAEQADTTFKGYPDGALPLLAEIGANDRAWFAEHRDDYLRLIAEPTKALVGAIGEQIQREISPHLRAVARVNGSIAPIASDQRFPAGRTQLYRDSLLLRFWEGDDKPSAATLTLRITAEAVGFGAGRSLDGPLGARFREAVAGPEGEVLADELDRLRRVRHAEIMASRRARVPRGYAADHPRADLLRLRWMQVGWTDAVPKAVGSARFAGWCARRLIELADVHGWLRDRV